MYQPILVWNSLEFIFLVRSKFSFKISQHCIVFNVALLVVMHSEMDSKEMFISSSERNAIDLKQNNINWFQEDFNWILKLIFLLFIHIPVARYRFGEMQLHMWGATFFCRPFLLKFSCFSVFKTLYSEFEDLPPKSWNPGIISPNVVSITRHWHLLYSKGKNIHYSTYWFQFHL